MSATRLAGAARQQRAGRCGRAVNHPEVAVDVFKPGDQAIGRPGGHAGAVGDLRVVATAADAGETATNYVAARLGIDHLSVLATTDQPGAMVLCLGDAGSTEGDE